MAKDPLNFNKFKKKELVLLRATTAAPLARQSWLCHLAGTPLNRDACYHKLPFLIKSIFIFSFRQTQTQKVIVESISFIQPEMLQVIFYHCQ